MTPPTVTLEVIRERERVCNDSEGPIETQSHKGEREREESGGKGDEMKGREIWERARAAVNS